MRHLRLSGGKSTRFIKEYMRHMRQALNNRLVLDNDMRPGKPVGAAHECYRGRDKERARSGKDHNLGEPYGIARDDPCNNTDEKRCYSERDRDTVSKTLWSSRQKRQGR